MKEHGIRMSWLAFEKNYSADPQKMEPGEVLKKKLIKRVSFLIYRKKTLVYELKQLEKEPNFPMAIAFLKQAFEGAKDEMDKVVLSLQIRTMQSRKEKYETSLMTKLVESRLVDVQLEEIEKILPGVAVMEEEEPY